MLFYDALEFPCRVKFQNFVNSTFKYGCYPHDLASKNSLEICTIINAAHAFYVLEEHYSRKYLTELKTFNETNDAHGRFITIFMLM